MGLSPDLKLAVDTALEKRRARMLRRHQQGKTLAEIAAEFGVSRQRVHQILAPHPDYRPRPTGPRKAAA